MKKSLISIISSFLMFGAVFLGTMPVVAASNAEANFAERLDKTLQNGTLSDALALFDTMPENLKNDVGLRTLHASLLLSAGKTGDAEKIASDLLTKQPKNVDVLLLNSMIAKQRKNPTKRLQFLNQIVAIDPNNPDANIELGNDQATKRKYKNARDYYLKAMKGDPKNIEALFGHAKMSYYLHRDDDSKKSFNKILELDPNNAPSYSYLAKFEAETRHFKKAMEYLSKAISLEPDNADYYLDLGNYSREAGKLDEAEKAWKKATELDPDYFLGYAYLAGLYDEQNKFDLAYDNYWKVVQKNPSYYYAYEALGMIAWHNENYADSIKFFGSAYKANPDNVSYALMVAANYQKMKKPQDCKKFTEQAMKGKDKNSYEYLSLRLFHDMTGDSTITLKIQSEEKKKKKGKFLFYLATYWDLKGKMDLAQKYYSEITDIQGADFFEYRLAEWAQMPSE